MIRWAISPSLVRQQERIKINGQLHSGDDGLVWQRLGTKACWTSCVQPFSFYHDFIPNYWAAAATEVAAAPIHRLCTLARKMGVRSFVVEDALERKEVLEEIDYLDEVSPLHAGEVSAAVVTFLSIDAVEGGDLPTLKPTDVIGQAVLVTYPTQDGRRHSFVFEAVFRLCARSGELLLLNHHVPIAATFDLSVTKQTIPIVGSYFCQQNGISSVCAHSAVRTLLMNHSSRRISVSELNKAWGIDPAAGKVGVQNVAASLETLDLTTTRYNFLARRPADAMSNDGIWSLIASLAESGTPALLVFETGPKSDHVVPVIGHTLNSDEWHPHGALSHLDDQHRTTSSSLWIDHLIINDDQLGPYFCMSRIGLFEAATTPNAIKPKHVIALLPNGFDNSPYAAETLARAEFKSLLASAASTLPDPSRWIKLLQTSAERRIFRTILISREEYAASLRSGFEGDDLLVTEAVLKEVTEKLPDSFWMCEVSLPNILLANRAKLGEILVSTTKKPRPEIFAVRLPGLIATLAKERLNAFRFPIESHIPLHAPRHNPNRW